MQGKKDPIQQWTEEYLMVVADAVALATLLLVSCSSRTFSGG